MSSFAQPHVCGAIDVVVVAGGASRRFGRDKLAVTRTNGQSQLAHVVAVVRSLRGQVIVASGTTPRHLPDTIDVPDTANMHGPLAGIRAGLEIAETDCVAVVAADLVAPDTALLTRLCHHRHWHGPSGLMPLVGGRAQPLHAVVDRRVRGRLTSALAAAHDHRVVPTMQAAGVEVVPESVWRQWAPEARPDLDMDVPEDLIERS